MARRKFEGTVDGYRITVDDLEASPEDVRILREQGTARTLTRYEPRAGAEPYRASELGSPIGQMERGSTAVGAGLRRVESAPQSNYPERRAAPVITETVPEFRGTQAGLPALTAEEIWRKGAEYWSQINLSETEKQWLRERYGGFSLGATTAQFADMARRHWARDARGRVMEDVCEFPAVDDAGVAEGRSERGEIFQLRQGVQGGHSLHREISPEAVVTTANDCSCERWPGSRRTGDSRLSHYGNETRGLKQLQEQLNRHWGTK